MSANDVPRDIRGHRLPEKRVNPNLGDRLRLMQWMQSQADRFAQERPSAERIAEEAKLALSINLTGHNVQAMKHYLGWDWHAKMPARVANASGAERAAKRRSELRELQARVATLEHRLTNLEVALGVAVDPLPTLT
jgi:hypothetical protein